MKKILIVITSLLGILMLGIGVLFVEYKSDTSKNSKQETVDLEDSDTEIVLFEEDSNTSSNNSFSKDDKTNKNGNSSNEDNANSDSKFSDWLKDRFIEDSDKDYTPNDSKPTEPTPVDPTPDDPKPDNPTPTNPDDKENSGLVDNGNGNYSLPYIEIPN